MKNSQDTLLGLFGSAVSCTGLVISAEELDHYISIACAVLGVLITLVTTVIIPVWKWAIKAKKDGKITEEEVQELHDTLINIKENTEDNK